MQSSQITYSVPIGQKPKGYSRVYRHQASINYLYKPPADSQTMQELWRNTVQKYAKNKCLEDYTYADVDQLTRFIGSWLVENNFKVVYIHSINRLEWLLIDIACMKYGIVSVALYDTLGREALEHTLGLTAGKVIAYSKVGVQGLIKAAPKNLKNITHMIMFDEIDQQLTKEIASHGIKIFPLKEIMARKLTRPYPLVLPDDPFSYCFTSGTTGMPKGVITTQGNLAIEVQSLWGEFPITDKDVHLSYLPLPHAFERVFIHLVMSLGAHVRFFSGSMTEIVKDFARVRPTILPIVPRLLNMFYAMLRPFGHVDKKLAEEAWKVKLQNWEKGDLTSPYDYTVFKRAKDAFGGRLKFMITGSAPIAAYVLQFFMVVLGCDIREGYGQTETTAASFFTNKGERTAGHVGGVCRAVYFKLVDIPEMNYTSDGEIPKGYVCLRGTPIFKGYFKDDKNTKEAIDADGWLHTGDVGQIEKNGALRLIDRKKNIYKLSQGEYVAPEKIYNIYLRCPLAAEAFVYGDSLQSFNVAIIVPNKDVLMKIAADKGIKKSFEELCEDRAITQMVLDQITQQGKHDGLVGFELAKKIRLHPTSFGNYGIFTNTLKLQRHVAKQTFQKQIDQMYKEPL